VVGILIIMWSKQIVEAVMWNQDDVLKIVKAWSSEASPARIDEQWNPILEFGSIPLIAQIINWVMWLTMLAIVVLIIIQWYKIFTKPDDPKTRESLKKAILYIIIWVLVIGAAYVISNVLVVNNISINSVVAE
jgi:H+/gluconate symporter-like permease